MKRGDILLENYLNKLNEGCDNNDENDGLEILKLESAKEEIIDRMSYRCCKEHNEGNGNTHSRRLTYLFGNSEEGADSEELCEHVVINEN